MAPDASAVGLGIVLWDSVGLVVAAGASHVDSNLSIVEAEALAILRGVELALDMGIKPFVVESDSAIVVNIANMVAHSLAKLALKASGDLFWMEDIPSSIAPLVSKDARFRL
ncbi:hypothetical protein ACOSP7_019369 [Xanthoceras sorbifolium]